MEMIPIDLLHPDKDALLKKWEKELAIVLPSNIFDTEAELAWIAEVATRHDYIIECGSYGGCSTKMMTLANLGATIVCLDDWADAGIYEQFCDMMDSEMEAGRVIAIRGNTSEGFAKIGIAPTFAFIDASHLYDGVKADIQGALKIMRGGLIAGHDYRHGNPLDGVNRAAHEMFPERLFFPADSIWATTLPENHK